MQKYKIKDQAITIDLSKVEPMAIWKYDVCLNGSGVWIARTEYFTVDTEDMPIHQFGRLLMSRFKREIRKQIKLIGTFEDEESFEAWKHFKIINALIVSKEWEEAHNE